MKSEFWESRKVVVTGGAGFLGSCVVERLKAQGCQQIFIPRSSEHDLRHESAIVTLLEKSRPDMIIHLAAVVGGIGANRDNPGRFFFDNLIMGALLMEQARLYEGQKIVAIGTTSSSLPFTPLPFP